MDDKITITFQASPDDATNLIAIATTILEISTYHHPDLPLALWIFLMDIEEMLRDAIADYPNNAWKAQEWIQRKKDWDRVRLGCQAIAKHLDILLDDE